MRFCIVKTNQGTKEKEFDLYQSKLSDLNSRKRKVSHSLMMNQRKLNVYRNELEKLGGSVEEALEKLDTLIALDHRRKTLIEQLETFEISNPRAGHVQKVC